MCPRLKGLSVCSSRLVFGVDNVYVAAHTPEEACDLIVAVFAHLRTTWNLDMKAKSGFVMACKGCDLSDFRPLSGIQLVSEFEILGWRVCDSGSMALQWRAVQAGAWALFWSNVRCRSWKKLGLRRRLVLLDRCVRPFVLNKLQIFGPTKFWVSQLDKLQRHMLSRALGHHRLPTDDLKTYWKRVSGCVREHLGSSVSVWSIEWLKATVRWDSHAHRDFCEQERFVRSHPDFVNPSSGSGNVASSSSFGTVEEFFGTSFSWAARLTRFMDSDFFESKRVVINQARHADVTHTKTLTRSVSGNVIPRYHDCVAFSRQRLSDLKIPWD